MIEALIIGTGVGTLLLVLSPMWIPFLFYKVRSYSFTKKNPGYRLNGWRQAVCLECEKESHMYKPFIQEVRHKNWCLTSIQTKIDLKEKRRYLEDYGQVMANL
jgi:hypothetical protein